MMRDLDAEDKMRNVIHSETHAGDAQAVPEIYGTLMVVQLRLQIARSRSRKILRRNPRAKIV